MASSVAAHSGNLLVAAKVLLMGLKLAKLWVVRMARMLVVLMVDLKDEKKVSNLVLNLVKCLVVVWEKLMVDWRALLMELW